MGRTREIGPTTYEINSLKLRCYTEKEREALPCTKLTIPQSLDACGRPIKHSIYDYCMGPREDGDICDTCGLGFLNCTGHFGTIEFALPIYNPCFFPEMLRLLRRSCMTCHHLTADKCDRLLLRYQIKAIACDRLDLVSKFDQLMAADDIMGSKKSWEYLRQQFEDLLAPSSLPRHESSSALARNANSALQASLKNFELKLARSAKSCPQCKSRIRAIRHDDRFKIFYTHQKAASRRSKNLNSTTFTEEEPSVDARKKILMEAVQTYFSPVDVKNHLVELWKNEREILSVFYQISDQENATNLVDLFIMEKMLVVPPKFRPVNVFNNIVSEPAESRLYNDIIQQNGNLQAMLKACENANKQDKDPKRKIQLAWLYLQRKVNSIYETSMFHSYQRQGQFKGVKAIIEKKEGILRRNVMGKRVDFAGRSVISPDPFLSTYEIGIPEIFAKSLDYPERVTDYNLAKLREYILRGPSEFPGAKYVKFADGAMVRLSPTNVEQRSNIAIKLAADGLSIVYRHLRDGDYLMINRQPTLHRAGFMGHIARVLRNEKVLRLHYSNCKSYNADFDGDELNFHYPQSEPCRVEIRELMMNTSNYIVPKDGTPLGGLIHDHIVSAVKLTCKSTFLDRNQYYFLVYCSFCNLSERRLVFLKPCILKPRVLWSGKQVVSTIIMNISRRFRCHITMESKCKITDKEWNASSKTTDDPYLSESIAMFLNGHLIRGVLDKSHIGASSFGLVHCCQEVYGGRFANEILSVLSRLCTAYLQSCGFTLGTEDICVLPSAIEQKLKICDVSRKRDGRKAMKLCFNVETSNPNVLSILYRQAHRNPEESSALLCELDAAYKSVSDLFQSKLTAKLLGPTGLLKQFPSNNLHFMVCSGAKGSKVNIMQMSCMLGQQELEGRRPPLQSSGSSLPCFNFYDMSPAAGGFIYNSFSSGLKPHEYFFHCMAGREGLVDTAVKTSRSGYLQRCLIKHLEGVAVEYDMTVRDSDGSVIQFVYGEDGLCPDRIAFLQKNHFNFFINNSGIIKQRSDYNSSIRCLKSNDRYATLCEIRRHVAHYEGETAKRSSAFLRFQQCISDQLHSIEPSNRKAHLLNAWRTCSEKIKSQFNLPKLQDPFLSRSFVGSNLESIPESSFAEIYSFTKHMHGHEKAEARDLLMYKTMMATANPGEPVGLVASQSLGEPSTQMTLNTFHFAGRGEMNVTLGIPRLREILMSASEKLSTPMAQVPILPGKEHRADKLCKRMASKPFREIIRKVDIEGKCVVHNAGSGPNEFQWRYKVFTSFVKMKSDGLRPAKLFEIRLMPAFVARIVRAIKESLSSSLVKATVIQRDQAAGQMGKKCGLAGEEGENEQSGDEDAADTSTGAEIADDEELGACKNSPDDDEVSYDEAEDEADLSDTNSVDDSHKAATEAEDSQIIGLQFTEESNLSFEDPGIPAKRRATENLAKMDDSRVRQVLKLSSYITDYRYCADKELWSEFTLVLDARNPRIDIAGILDNVVKTTSIRHGTNIKRAFVIAGTSPSGTPEKIFQTEGIQLQELMMHSNLFDLNRLTCNSIHEMAKVFGIEAANRALIQEIIGVFSAYGITVDHRHLSLVADYLTFDGRYQGFNRFCIAANTSPVQKMSFETAMAVIKDSVMKGCTDEVTSPSSRILVGQPARLGTGFMDILPAPDAANHKKQLRRFDCK